LEGLEFQSPESGRRADLDQNARHPPAGSLLQPFKMPRSPTIITGTVRDLAGHPVAGARIAFVEGPVPLADIAALTAADGTFSLTAPVAGIYRIACHADGF